MSISNLMFLILFLFPVATVAFLFWWGKRMNRRTAAKRAKPAVQRVQLKKKAKPKRVVRWITRLANPTEPVTDQRRRINSPGLRMRKSHAKKCAVHSRREQMVRQAHNAAKTTDGWNEIYKNRHGRDLTGFEIRMIYKWFKVPGKVVKSERPEQLTGRLAA